MHPVLRSTERNALYERWRLRIFCITWLTYAGFYLTRKSFSVAKIDLARPEVLGLTKVQMGWMDGAYLTTYALGQFLWGFCGDHYGTRKVILLGLVGSVISAFAMGASTVTVMMGLFFCLQGIFQA